MILFQNYVLRGYPLDSLVNATEMEKRLLRHALIMEEQALGNIKEETNGTKNRNDFEP